MARRQYSKSDIKDLIQNVLFLKDMLDKKSNVIEDDDLLYINKKLVAIRFDGMLVPSLKLLIEQPNLLPQVIVDKGAIKFVVKGADIMRPGITQAQSFRKDDFVVIVDENFKKPLAVGKAMFSSVELLAKDSGKVVLNLHQIGDEYWEKS